MGQLGQRLGNVVGAIGQGLPLAERIDLLIRLGIACPRDRSEAFLRAYVVAAQGLGLGGMLSRLVGVPPEVASPDAALHRLPWTALRDPKNGLILLEDYPVVTLPHGPMLLDRLTEEKRKAPAVPTLLAKGGVAYDEKPRASAELAMRGPAAERVKWSSLARFTKL